MDAASRERSKLERRLLSMILWGIVVLCAPSVSCSRGGGSNSIKAWRTEPLVEGTGVGTLRIDEAMVANAASAFGVSSAEARAVGDRGVLEMRTPLYRLSFVPPSDGQGPQRLYAMRAALSEDIYLGKTSKGIGFLDSADAIREAYGPPDAEWITMNDHIHYYRQGVLFTTQHPREIPSALYAKARKTLGKQPSEGLDARVVTGIMVVRPFTVTKAGSRIMAGQRVISSRPETDLLVSEF